MKKYTRTWWICFSLAALVFSWWALGNNRVHAPEIYHTPHEAKEDHRLNGPEPSVTLKDDIQRRKYLFTDDLLQQLINYDGYWNYSLRSHLLRLPPSELLGFLESDDALVREDARDLATDIYGWCTGALVFQDEKSKKYIGKREEESDDQWLLNRMQAAVENGWCGALAQQPDAYERMRRLQDLIYATDLSGQDRYDRAETYVKEAAARDDGSLQELILGERSDLMVLALNELRSRNDHSIISDWSVYEQLAPSQYNEVMSNLRIGLECQWLNGCTAANSPPISAMCFNIGYQCDSGRDFYSIMRRNLTPVQFDALIMLMNQVNTYRRKHG